jgi:hypothetical protein
MFHELLIRKADIPLVPDVMAVEIESYVYYCCYIVTSGGARILLRVGPKITLKKYLYRLKILNHKNA